MTPQTKSSVVISILRTINRDKDKAFDTYVDEIKKGNTEAANKAQDNYCKLKEDYRQQVKASDEILRLENAIRIPIEEMTFEQLCELNEQGKLKLLKTANR